MAPPGKRIESPPLKEEFEKELEAAKREEKNSGEVAETEPNAQLQKLDSKDKKEETIVSDLAIVAIPIPILVEQVAAVQVQVNAIPVNPNLITGNKKLDISVHSTGKDGEIALDSELAASNNQTGGTQELLQLISAMQGRKANTAPLPTATNTAAKPSENSISAEIKSELNITSVQSSSTNLLAGQAEAVAKPDVKAIEPNVKGETVKTHEVVSGGISVDVSGGQLQGESGSDDASASDHKNSETAVFDLQGQATNANSRVEGKLLTFSHALNNDDRQRVIETLTKKIEELSVRSVRNEVRVEMHPPEMGSVVVNLRNELEGLTATLTASNDSLRQALHESRNDLAGALADRNVGQVRIEVRSANADTMNMGQQFNQSQSQNQGQNAQQQPRHAVVDHRNTRHNSSPEVEDKPVARRMATTLIDMEI